MHSICYTLLLRENIEIKSCSHGEGLATSSLWIKHRPIDAQQMLIFVPTTNHHAELMNDKQVQH